MSWQADGQSSLPTQEFIMPNISTYGGISGVIDSSVEMLPLLHYGYCGQVTKSSHVVVQTALGVNSVWTHCFHCALCSLLLCAPYSHLSHNESILARLNQCLVDQMVGDTFSSELEEVMGSPTHIHDRFSYVQNCSGSH